MTDTVEVSIERSCFCPEPWTLVWQGVVWHWSLSDDTMRLLDMPTKLFMSGTHRIEMPTKLNRFGCRYMKFSTGATLSALPESETSERKLELRIPDALFNYGLETHD